MIISFILWCIGMILLKDDHYDYKDGLCICMAIVGFMEFMFEIIIIGKYLGLGA